MIYFHAFTFNKSKFILFTNEQVACLICRGVKSYLSLGVILRPTVPFIVVSFMHEKLKKPAYFD